MEGDRPCLKKECVLVSATQCWGGLECEISHRWSTMRWHCCVQSQSVRSLQPMGYFRSLSVAELNLVTHHRFIAGEQRLTDRQAGRQAGRQTEGWAELMDRCRTNFRHRGGLCSSRSVSGPVFSWQLRGALILSTGFHLARFWTKPRAQWSRKRGNRASGCVLNPSAELSVLSAGGRVVLSLYLGC